MTRDEAIEKFGSVGGSSFASSAWIDRFVAIGILKLDEPKSLRDRFRQAMLDEGYSERSVGLRDAMDCLDRALAAR